MFLELMIAHHQGAVEMADAALERSTNDVVVDPSRNSIVASQQAEIDLMNDMLAERGADPARSPAALTDGSASSTGRCSCWR